MNRRTLLAMPAPLPTYPVEELHMEQITLFEDDYSWYLVHGTYEMCVSFGSAADNNWDENYSPCPTGEHRTGECMADSECVY